MFLFYRTGFAGIRQYCSQIERQFSRIKDISDAEIGNSVRVKVSFTQYLSIYSCFITLNSHQIPYKGMGKIS